MLLILTFVSVCCAWFQLDRCEILKVPVSKLRETHILIEFRIILASAFKFIRKLLCEFLCLFRGNTLRRLEGCRLDDLLVFCIITEGYLYSESIAPLCNSSHK